MNGGRNLFFEDEAVILCRMFPLPGDALLIAVEYLFLTS